MPPPRPVPDGLLEEAAKGTSINQLAVRFTADAGTVSRWLNLPKSLQFFANRRGGILGQARRKAEDESERSIGTLVEIRDDKDAPAPARVASARELLEIAEVSGKQRVELSGEVRTGPLEGKSEAEVERIPFEYVAMILREHGEESLAVLVADAADRLASVKTEAEEPPAS